MRDLKQIIMQLNKVLAIVCLGSLLVCNACQRETKDERIKREYEQFTLKECPKDMNFCTRMDSICYDIDTRTLTEYYTLKDTLDDESILTNELLNGFRDEILKQLKTSLQMKPYKDEGINFRYDYRSFTTGKLLFELYYTKEEYGN